MDANLLNLLNFMMPQANTSTSTTQSTQQTTVGNPGLFAQQLASILGNLDAQNTDNLNLSDQLLANLANPDQNILMENLQTMQASQLSDTAFNSDQLAQQLEIALAQIMKQLTNGQTNTDQIPQSIRGLFSSMLEQIKKLDFVNPQATETQMWMSVKAVTISVQKTDSQELEMIRTEQSELFKTQSGQNSDQDMWFKVRITVVSVTAWQSFAGLSATENPSSNGTVPECVPVSMLKGNPDLTVLPNITDPVLYSSLDQASKNNGITLLDQIKQLAPQMKALNGELEITIDNTSSDRSTSSAINNQAQIKNADIPTEFSAVKPSELIAANLDTQNIQQESTKVVPVNAEVTEIESALLNNVVDKPSTINSKTELINSNTETTIDADAAINILPTNDTDDLKYTAPESKLNQPIISKDSTINSLINSSRPNIQSQNLNSGNLNNPNQPQTLSFDQIFNQVKPTVQTAAATDAIKTVINPQPLELNPNIPQVVQPITTKPSTNIPPVAKLTDIPHSDIKLNTLMNAMNNAKQQFGHNLTLPPQIDELVKFSGVGIIKTNIQSQTEMQTQDRILAQTKSNEVKTAHEQSDQPVLRDLRNDSNLMFAPRLDLELHNTRRTLTDVQQTLRQELLNLHEQAQKDPQASSPVRDITIKLDPPQLGEMTARMQVKGGEMMIQIQVASQQTRDLLERELQTLRSQLKDSGLAGAQIKVELQSERHGQSQQQGNQWQTAHGNSSGNLGSQSQFGENAEPLPESVIQTNSIWALLEPTTTTIGVNLYNDPQAKYY